MLFILKALASTLSVEKKNKVKDRNTKKIYKIFKRFFLNLINMPYNSE